MHELDEAEPEREEQADGQKAVNEHIAPEDRVQEIDHGDHDDPSSQGAARLVAMGGPVPDFDARSKTSASPP
jgi:hypothetical protein